MVQDFVHTSGSLLQAWQLVSSFAAMLVFCVVAGGLIWRMRAEARVIENVHDDAAPPVLQRLKSNSTAEVESDANKIAALTSFKKSIAPPTRPANSN